MLGRLLRRGAGESRHAGQEADRGRLDVRRRCRRYDITNTVMSLGLDRLWRRRTRQAIEPQPGERILDLAAGTGVSTAELADRTSCRPVAWISR